MDYASEDTRQKGLALIEREMEKVTNPVVKERAKSNLKDIEDGKRDFRF